MSDFSIQTAQNVSIEQNLAGIGQRILAVLIDGIFLGLLYYFIFLLLGKSGILDNFKTWAFMSVLTLPYFLYYPVFQYLNNGQTLGKQMLQIRVVKTDNTHPGLGDFLIRWVLRLFEVNTIPGLALVVMLMNDKKQRLGDIAARTTVVSEVKRASLKQSIFEEINPDYQPVFVQVQQLKDADIQLIKDVYREAKQLKNRDVLASLTQKIEELLDLKKPLDFSDTQFIDKIIKDYNYFARR